MLLQKVFYSETRAVSVCLPLFKGVEKDKVGLIPNLLPSQWENFKLSWLPFWVLMKKVELVVSWRLENNASETTT